MQGAFGFLDEKLWIITLWKHDTVCLQYYQCQLCFEYIRERPVGFSYAISGVWMRENKQLIQASMGPAPRKPSILRDGFCPFAIDSVPRISEHQPRTRRHFRQPPVQSGSGWVLENASRMRLRGCPWSVIKHHEFTKSSGIFLLSTPGEVPQRMGCSSCSSAKQMVSRDPPYHFHY